jgi:hypothetical protein
MAEAYDSYLCPICNLTYRDYDFDDHLETAHENYEQIGMRHEGEYMPVKDYVQMVGRVRYVPREADYGEQLVKVPTDPTHKLGMNVDDVIFGTSESFGSGSFATDPLVTYCINGLSPLIGRNAAIDSPDFMRKLLVYLVDTDATDKMGDFGSVILRSSHSVNMENLAGVEISAGFKELPWQDVIVAMMDVAKTKSFKMTPRILAKALSNWFRKAIFHGTLFDRHKVTGTSLSQRCGIPHRYFYTALSFFPAIKDPTTWSKEEAHYYEAKRVNAKMLQWERTPTNLMPSIAVDAREPENPSTMTLQEQDVNESDYQLYKLRRNLQREESYGGIGKGSTSK